MSIKIPAVFTPTHDEELARTRPTTEETQRKLLQNLNYLANLIPLGTIIFVNTNQPGVNIPDPRFWQLCDGSNITDAHSPLRTIGVDFKSTPDMSNRFIRGTTVPNVNLALGQYVFSLAHDHGGKTGWDEESQQWCTAFDSDRHERRRHTHTIEQDLKDTITVDYPGGYQVAAYMKIN